MNDAILETLKSEGINTFSKFYAKNKLTGELEMDSIYICTRGGSEVEIDKISNFNDKYEIKETFNARKNSYGYVYKSHDYEIVEKSTGKVIFNQ